MTGWNAAEESLLISPRSVRWFYVRCGVLFYLAWALSFKAIGHFAAKLPGHDLTCVIDRMIPFIPAFIWPYVYCYIFPLLLGFWAKDWHRINRGFLSMIFANLAAFVVFVAFPVVFAKPPLGNSLAERVIALDYRIDAPAGSNNLPSLHVIFAWIVCLMALKQGTKKGITYGFLFSALLITISTLFVKQHLLIDAVMGIVWALGSWMVARWFYRRWIDEETDAMAAFLPMLRKTVPFILSTAMLILFLGWLHT